jgi:hypothetical protein
MLTLLDTDDVFGPRRCDGDVRDLRPEPKPITGWLGRYWTEGAGWRKLAKKRTGQRYRGFGSRTECLIARNDARIFVVAPGMLAAGRFSGSFFVAPPLSIRLWRAVGLRRRAETKK